MSVLTINQRRVGTGCPPYLIAELSANHGQSLDYALAMVKAFAESGAQAIKAQAYTPDTLSVRCKSPRFLIKEGLWQGQYQHDLYEKGHMPWEWHKPLAECAHALGVDFFSTPFDETAVDYLEQEIDPPCYKISSFEITHTPLLECVAKTGKPVIMSTGMASLSEIEEALSVLRSGGVGPVALLKCITQYPAQPKGFNLNSMVTLRERFNCSVGLSDHSLGNEICLGATALGACIIEKHVVLDHNVGGIDGAFALDPAQFRIMADAVRKLFDALGSYDINPSAQEKCESRFRRTIFACKPIVKGAALTSDNIRIIRMAGGLEPKHWSSVVGRTAACSMGQGDPLTWKCIES